MANSYTKGKWAGTLEADIKSDGTKELATLGDDFVSELENLKKCKTRINETINKIKREVKGLKDHSDTGTMARTYLNNTERRLDKMHNSLATEVNTLSNAVTAAQNEYWRKFKQWFDEWQASQN